MIPIGLSHNRLVTRASLFCGWRWHNGDHKPSLPDSIETMIYMIYEFEHIFENEIAEQNVSAFDRGSFWNSVYKVWQISAEKAESEYRGRRNGIPGSYAG